MSSSRYSGEAEEAELVEALDASMGCSLTVGREILVLDGLGSNPSAPAFGGSGFQIETYGKCECTRRPPTKLGDLAQLVERLYGMQEVAGSSPAFSTRFIDAH